MKYKEAINLIKNRSSKKLANNTYLLKDGVNFVIRLHETNIVTITPKNHYILNNGGWQTMTTKDRLNKYLPCNIYQEKGLWYLSGSLYYNGMELNSKGNPVKPKNPNKTEKNKKHLDKSVTKYIKGFTQDIDGEFAGRELRSYFKKIKHNLI